MFKHYLLVTFRSILKDKGYSIVNIVGLSIAIACCLLLIFWIRFELSFEKNYSNADRIFKVIEIEQRVDGIFYEDYIRDNIGTTLKERFPQIEALTFMSHELLPFVVDGTDGDGIMADYTTANPDYIKMFSYIYLEGSPQGVAQSKEAIISEEMAIRFFGSPRDAIRKTISFGNTLRITIGAVVRIPKNTQIHFDILDLYRSQRVRGLLYVMLKKGVQLTPDFEQQIKGVLSTQRETENTLMLQPLLDVHLHSPKEITKSEAQGKFGDLKQIYLFSLAALLILVIAVINYVNTSIARALSRMKEVGVRKITGSNRWQLVIRFLFESFVIALIGMILSLALVKYAFPAFCYDNQNIDYFFNSHFNYFLLLLTNVSSVPSAFIISSMVF